MAGSRRATRMPMMAMTTSSSTKVKARVAVIRFAELLIIAISARHQVFTYSHTASGFVQPLHEPKVTCLPSAPVRDMLPRLHMTQQRNTDALRGKGPRRRRTVEEVRR